MTIVVSLVGGPGTGKSTTAAGAFFELKQAGINCELVTEYAKDVVWGRTTATLGNQIYIFGKQYHRFWRLLDQVDVIVTDAPLVMSLYYGQNEGETFRELVLEVYTRMRNMTYFLERKKAYNPAGRTQTEDQARAIDDDLRTLMASNGVPYTSLPADRDAPHRIAELVLSQLQEDEDGVE